MLKKVFTLVFMAFAGFAVARAQTGTDIVLVLPFENTSGKAEFNWVGESFADSLSDLLKVPNLSVISNEQRKLVQQRLRIPLTTLPSLATSLKLARESNATLLISGRYTILPASDDTAATINVTARIVRVTEGRVFNELIGDRPSVPPLDFIDGLGNLQTLQGELAWKILALYNGRSMEYPRDQLIQKANRVPAKAFEAYIKGLLTPATAVQTRENYFRNASRVFSDATSGGIYSEAELELGHVYLEQRKGRDAINAFERVIAAYRACRESAKLESDMPGLAKRIVQCSDGAFAEASFYSGMMYLQQGAYETATAVLQPIADELKLASVYNALGAIWVQASRSERKDQAKAAAQLTAAVEAFRKVTEALPENANVRFNYGVALFLSGSFVEAAEQFRAASALNAKDGDAHYLLAKTLEMLKDPTAARVDDDARRLLTSGNRYANLERVWQKDRQVPDISLRVDNPTRRDFVSVVLNRASDRPVQPQISESDRMLGEARVLFKNGSDTEAGELLRRILLREGMNAEAYLLLGKISLRAGDKDNAISLFKTAIFWDNRILDAYINLSKIYVEKGDCLQAKNYAASAKEIDGENQDVQALQRLSERCSK